MRFFSRRFLEEFLLYSSHFVVFFILMLVTTPGIVTLQPISIATNARMLAESRMPACPITMCVGNLLN